MFGCELRMGSTVLYRPNPLGFIRDLFRTVALIPHGPPTTWAGVDSIAALANLPRSDLDPHRLGP